MIKGYLKQKPSKAYGKLNKEVIKIGTDILDATAQDFEVVVGKTYYARSGKHIGTLKAFKIREDKVDQERTAWQIDALNFNSNEIINKDKIVDQITIGMTPLKVGVDTTDGTITPEKVLEGYIGYSQKEKVIGELRAYQVEEQIIEDGKSRLIINTLEKKPSSDYLTVENNIKLFKNADKVLINRQGGELATDEEYIIAENKFQILASKIMGVIE